MTDEIKPQEGITAAIRALTEALGSKRRKKRHPSQIRQVKENRSPYKEATGMYRDRDAHEPPGEFQEPADNRAPGYGSNLGGGCTWHRHKPGSQ